MIAQRREIYAPHVRAINELVDDLGVDAGGGRAPYVAPWYVGVEAPILAVLRDPGPGADAAAGSGFLCTNNNDETSRRQQALMQGAGIDPRDVLPWNAYPWYINAAPNSAQLRAGVEPLRRLVALLPGLRVILLLGRDAQRGWRYVDATHPHLPEERGITVLPTFHPGRQALWHQDAAVRTEREEHLRVTFQQARSLVDKGF